jgi:drug/metabolite transporter (DMT)-like permease
MAGALLLNLEAPFTMALAVLFFGEHLGRRAALAGALIVGGASLLALAPGDLRARGVGVACIAAACLAWGLDNNLTQRLSLKDPIALVQWKTLGAGACNIALAAALGARWPGARTASAALALGFLSYGLSIVLDVWSLRLLGAAREAALFTTAPFVGALASVALLGDPMRPLDGAAAALMLAGVVALVRERHGHRHTHEPLEHEHAHTHDAHHQHAHAPGDPSGEPHSHRHRHEPLTHDHPHVPDLHHRHRH